MDASSIEDPFAHFGNRSPCPSTLQRVGSGGSDVIDPAEIGVEAESESSRKPPSSRFKGVVPQPNGRWGAQIYETHRRVWLGTFSDEAAAALAYDAAAQRFRGRDAVTNFKPLDPADDADAAELCFLRSRSKAEIVDMLRKHTYADELRRSGRSSGTATKPKGPPSPRCEVAAVGEPRKSLFEKAVTPSDVGKLNRLVIPKQHAENHLPRLTGGAVSAGKGVLLSFEDGGGKLWRFRFSYWSSSQSYVLTKGWSRFVREKGLEAGDVVTFEQSTGPERRLFIDRRQGPAVRIVRLFGVDIARNPTAANGAGGKIGKRSIDQMEVDSMQELLKRQCLETYNL